jgi:hypothetical protein
VAGDWIKMRTNLWDDPRVARLCDLTDQGEAAVVGGLYWLWAMADSHTEDGILPGLTTRAIDRKTGVQGLGDALVSVGWVADHPEGVRIIGFEQHNGTSAKRRCTDAQAKANKRKPSAEAPSNVVEMSACDADKAQTSDGQKTDNCRAREEKRREEEYTPPNGGDGAQAAPAKSKRGSRLADDWFLPQAWGQWALDRFPHFTPEVVRDEALKFANHWRSKSGKDATKLDWQGTWQNWCMSDICQRSHAPPRRSNEPNYARHMRERVEQAAGSLAHIVAAKAPGKRPPEPWEIAIEQKTIEADRARTLAIGVD